LTLLSTRLFHLHLLLLKMSFIHTHCHFKHPWRLHRPPEDRRRHRPPAKLLKQSNRCIGYCTKITVRTVNITSLFAVTLESGHLSNTERRTRAVAFRSVLVSSDLRTFSGCTHYPRHPQAPPWSLARISHGVPLASISLQLYVNVTTSVNLHNKKVGLRTGKGIFNSCDLMEMFRVR